MEVPLPGRSRRQRSGVRGDHGCARDEGTPIQGSGRMIDSRALVPRQADIAPDVEIGPFTVIGADVVIGPGTWIGPHAVINGPTRIGTDNKIFQFASLGDA